MYQPTELCSLAIKYGADKCPQIGHTYTLFYNDYFKDMRQSVKKVLELGIGNNRYAQMVNTKGSFAPTYDPKNVPAPFKGYQMGASLRMWRDFFPNAMVYGADKAPEAMFEDDRIKTMYFNEDFEKDIRDVIVQTGTDIDIVIDDACHHFANQVFLFRTLMPLLQKSVIYVVEDCRRTRRLRDTFPEYECLIPQLPVNPDPNMGDGLVVFRNKQ